MKDVRGVGEVSVHNLESLRSLIIYVGMFLDLVNVIENRFEIPLLQKELSVKFCLSLNFCLYLHVIRKRKYNICVL